MNNLSAVIAILTIISFVLSPTGIASAQGLPEGATVQSGDVSISNLNPNTLNVDQASAKAIIDWNSFSIASGNTVNFNQPGSDALALNRVTGGSISDIFGSLNANGKVWLLNPNGIVFGPNSRINAAGFLASTLDISNQDFLNKIYVFTKSPDSNGYIINKGEITAADGGYVALMGQAVKNEGIIQARLGKVVLAAGEKIALELDSNGMISVAVDEAVSEALTAPDGKEVNDAALNTGTIIADGGTVILTASILENIFENAVNNEGLIRATSLVNNKGEVYLLAKGTNAKAANRDMIDVSAAAESSDGGFVEVSGERVDIDEGDINVTSKSGQKGHFLLDPVSDFWIVDSAAGDDDTGSTIGEEWLENFDGNLTLQAGNDVYFLIDDNNLDLQNFNNGEIFRIEAGNDINLNDDSIVTQGGNVELIGDLFAGVSDGAGNVNLGIGDGIATNGGNTLLSGVNVNVTAPVNTGGGNVDFAATNNIFHGPRGDVTTFGGYFNGIAGNDYIFMNDVEVDTAGGAENIGYGGTLYMGSLDPQTESTYSWEYVSDERMYHFKELGYYYYDADRNIVYVPLVKGDDIGKDGIPLLSGAGLSYIDIGNPPQLYTEFEWGGETWRYYEDPSLNDAGLNHVLISDNQYAWEDLIDLGDRDYNDVAIRFLFSRQTYESKPIPPDETPSPEIVIPQLLWDLRFKIPNKHLTDLLQITYTNGPIELLAEQVYFYHPLFEMNMYETLPLDTGLYEFLDGRINYQNPALLPVLSRQDEEEKEK